ncbi:MAG TPA: glycosyltransferase family 10, partial [Candidatus Baltobacteraceae bacterium]|nr:glycosyltransferase family 10 [Candidatus Baltobacteraceae bacterium]
MKSKVKIDFCDIGWNHVKTNHFLYRVLSERFDLELCDQPDFLVHDLFGHAHRLHSGVRILFTGEGAIPNYSIDDYSINPCASDDSRHLHLPAYVFHGPPERIIKQSDDHERILAAKTKFCSFVVSNYNPGRNQNRLDFFDLLSRYKRVDSAGKIRNNIGGRLRHGAQAKAEFLNQYKFNICFENSSKPGYTTEKIYDAMVSRCLPIYWGDPMINQQFNPRSFLNRADFPSDEALVEKIIELDKDDAKYLEFMRQPYLPNDEPTIYFNLDRIRNFFEQIFTTSIQPAAQKYRSWIQPGR